MNKTPVLVDMNLTEDFAAGFLLAATDPEFDILGISLSFGETDLATAAANTAGVMALAGLTCDVALGADRPLRRTWLQAPRPLPLCCAVDGLQLDGKAALTPSPLPAWDFLYEKLRAAREPVTLLCAGPLTNIAILLQRHPDAKDHIARLVWRGGTQRHATLGVVRDLQTWLDPDAARAVLHAGLNVVLCPVDMGFAAYATQAEIDAGIPCADGVRHQLNRLLKKRWCQVNEDFPMGRRTLPLPLQDVAAVAYLLDASRFVGEDFYCEVDLVGELTFGMCVVDINRRSGKANNITLLRQADRDYVVSLLYRSI